jgi:hypothetical protein
MYKEGVRRYRLLRRLQQFAAGLYMMGGERVGERSASLLETIS